MSSLRNRRSSLHEPHYTTSLYRGRSDFSGLSSLTNSTSKTYDSPHKDYSSPRDFLSSFRRTSSSNDYREGRGSLGKASSNGSMLHSKEASVEREPLLARPIRRRSESTDYRIGAGRDERKNESFIRDAESRLSRLSSFSSLTKTKSSLSSSSTTTVEDKDIQPRTSCGLGRATSRNSSFGSPHDLSSSHRHLVDENPTRLSSLKRSLSGRRSGSFLSPTSQPNPTKTIKASSSADGSAQRNGGGTGVCGLRNVGNSCYQNAVIQFLNAIPEFHYCMRDVKNLDSTSKIAPEISRLLYLISRATDHEAVAIHSLRRRLGLLDYKWAGYGQEDAHEFLTQIISALQEDCNRNPSKPRYIELEDCDDIRTQAREEWKYSKQWNDSDIDDIFGFQMHNQITCPSCKHQSNRFGYLTSLEVPLPDTAVDLQDCLRDFTSVEMLDKENSWQCPKCRKHVQAVQQLRLSRLPKILIVCLKRFGSSKSRFSSFRSWKNTVPVRLPVHRIQLRDILSPTVDSKTVRKAAYEVAGIVDHTGSVNFGHYTARVKNTERNTWYLMNDEIVRQIGQPVGPSESAYIVALRQTESS